MTASTTAGSSFQASASARYSVGTRVAGTVLALGYLSGLVDGPVVAVVGGLALITFGRSLLVSRLPSAMAGGALAVVAASLGIVALRWEALGLDQLRGVQAVLGPTLAVGPAQAAVGSGIAAGAALIALALWLSEPWFPRRGAMLWSALEGAVWALALVTLFVHPAPEGLSGDAGSVAAGLARWCGAVVAVDAAALVGAWGLHRLGRWPRLIFLVTAGAAVAVAAGLVVGTA